MAKCEICSRSALKDGVSLYRINEKGVEGKWACQDHIHLFPKKLAALDPETIELCDLISSNKTPQAAGGAK